MNLTTGEKLKDLRTNAKLTGEQLCAELERKYGYVLTKSKYSEIENDKSKDFGYQTFLYLGKFYNVSVDYLLGLSDNPTTNEDVKTACKITGLSQNAISKLSAIDGISVIDSFINSPEFDQISHLLIKASCFRDWMKFSESEISKLNSEIKNTDSFSAFIALGLPENGLVSAYKLKLDELFNCFFDTYIERRLSEDKKEVKKNG